MRQSTCLRRLLVAGIALLWIFALSPAVRAEEKTIIFAFDPAYPPYTFMDGAQPSGFALDVLIDALAGSSFRIVSVPAQWESVQRMVALGVADMTAGMARTPEREAVYAFSRLPFAAFRVVLLAASDIADDPHGPSGLHDLQGKAVATQRGSLYESILRERGHTPIELYETEALALAAMLRGEADAFCGTDSTAWLNLAPQERERVRQIGGPLHQGALYFALAPGRAELLHALDQGMERAMSDGAYVRIFTQWFGSPPGEDLARLLPGAGH
ncbi:ABC-type transporter, periplasmic subunit family 3 [Alkalidesulfovibrio alkalitolerans DSM 16529]|jgi:cytidine deaminase|uniref:ABC-type transporter, periplasmic subunit family 3 n=1 Tax=Alkalidesulfovibrio alkalitolerans DSM 16529 TaxID=1121439 RepID=S7T374_9BACT|nr:transporter substrate-binding domain-containing protein [Alkalidesulfovibrio alkalitolerans]EPR30950.1 ABC-type transporter, periplasmic subunit family 3 [Alkalidesulfovibrio alkalitolerans DSM 16529]